MYVFTGLSRNMKLLDANAFLKWLELLWELIEWQLEVA